MRCALTAATVADGATGVPVDFGAPPDFQALLQFNFDVEQASTDAISVSASGVSYPRCSATARSGCLVLEADTNDGTIVSARIEGGLTPAVGHQIEVQAGPDGLLCRAELSDGPATIELDQDIRIDFTTASP